MNKKSGTLYIGTSGYHYNHWREIFYPKDLPKEEWFNHYSKSFNTVEINNTFYNLPEEKTFDDWRKRAPKGFCYTLKFSQYCTHRKRLKEPEEPIALFLERANRLKDNLGPILVQLPPRWKPNQERLAHFLQTAPADVRWGFEFRDERWLCEEIYETLREHHVALCIHDMIDDHPQIRTADWTYLRFHGDHYHGSYSPQALSGAARRIKKFLSHNMDVYVYFNNDAEGYAVQNALDLKRFALE